MCSYDEPVSRQLRQSAAHNVVLIDGQEQLASDPKLRDWHTTAAADFASGQIAAGGLVHQRSVLFVKPDYWVVQDTISGEGNHEVTRLFHFPTGPAKMDGNAAQTTFPDGTNIRVQPVDHAKLEMRTGLIATGLVTVEKTPVVALTSKGCLPQTLCTLLLPFVNENELPKVTALAAAGQGVSKFLLIFPNGQRDEITIAAEPTALTVQNHKASAHALCIRQGSLANTIIMIP